MRYSILLILLSGCATQPMLVYECHQFPAGGTNPLYNDSKFGFREYVAAPSVDAATRFYSEETLWKDYYCRRSLTNEGLDEFKARKDEDNVR